MNRLAEVRTALGMTQMELSELTGVSQASLSKIEMESDRLALRGDTLIKLCKAMNVSADYLLGLTDDPRPLREGPVITLQEFALLEAYRKGDIKRVLRLLVEDGNGVD
jgi:transcriptional regulator with XRE-family HTH domain